MRKTTFVLLFSALSLRALAQGSAKMNSDSKWQLSIFSAPEINHRVLYNGDSLFNSRMVPFREAVERPAMGFYIGGGIKFKAGKHWIFSSGLAFTERTYQLPKTSIAEAASKYRILFVVKHASTTHLAQKYRFGYISVPLTVEYDWHLKGVVIGLFAGCTADYFLYNKGKSAEYDKDGNKIIEVVNMSKLYRRANIDGNYKPIVGNVLGGLSFSMPIKDRIGIAISPYTKWSTATIKNPRLTQRLYSYGLKFALTYDL